MGRRGFPLALFPSFFDAVKSAFENWGEREGAVILLNSLRGYTALSLKNL
jgi:hypothetical protein